MEELRDGTDDSTSTKTNVAQNDETRNDCLGKTRQNPTRRRLPSVHSSDIFIDYAQGKIDKLHDLGKVVVCYISIGSVEDWRDDAEDFPAEAIGNDLDGWEGEKWLDVNNEVIFAVYELLFHHHQHE